MEQGRTTKNTKHANRTRTVTKSCLMNVTKIVVLVAIAVATVSAQTPSPTPPTPHQRIAQTETPGRRVELSALKGAVIFVGEKFDPDKRVPLVVHFHGAPWLVEQHVAKHLPHAVLITVQLGEGSRVYGQPFTKTETFRSIIEEARTRLKVKNDWSSTTLTAFSAGYGGIRAILRDERNVALVDNVLLLDGFHASYSPEGKSLANGGVINEEHLDSYLKFAELAAAGKKTFVITHSQIVPGSYASTTECANYLLWKLALPRRMEPGFGPMGMQQLTAADARRFHVRGYSGNTTRDHVDHFHSMPEWFKLLGLR